MEDLLQVNPKFAGLTRDHFSQISTGPTKVDYSLQHAQNTQAIKISPLKTLVEITPIFTEIMKSFRELTVSESTMFNIAQVGCSIIAPLGTTLLLSATIDGANESIIQATDTASLPRPNVPVTDNTQLSSILNMESSSRTSSGDINWQDIISRDTGAQTGITFMIASLFKMIRKEPEAYLRSLPHIKITYQAFYGGASEVVGEFTPSVEALHMVSNGFRTYRHVVAGIIFRIAAAEKALVPGSKGYQALQFLMFQHLSYPGMHAYRMVAQIMAKCKLLRLDQILSWLTTVDTKDAIDAIYRIATTFDVASKKKRDQREFLWKYARHLNEGYFLELQSKKNKELVAILAALHKKLGLDSGNTDSSTDNIAILHNQAVLREDANEFAEVFIRYYKALSVTNGATVKFSEPRVSVPTDIDEPVRSAQKRKAEKVGGSKTKRLAAYTSLGTLAKGAGTGALGGDEESDSNSL